MIKKLFIVALLFVGTMAFAQPGSNDSTFNTLDDGILGDVTWFFNSVQSTSIQADGKIILGGNFYSLNGITGINRIARLNADGTRDASFKPGTGFNGTVRSTSIQADGKIVVGGEFTSFNGKTGINRIVRLHADGTRDTTFNTGMGSNGDVFSTFIQSDGKIIVGGDFTSFNGKTGINRIVRLNTNGSLDTTFNTGTGLDRVVLSTTIQADGKIIAGGDFTSFNGTTRINRIVRLNTNGSLDATFNSGTGFNNFVRSTVIQSDGKIIIGGDFSSYNDTTNINDIVRLNADGTRDTTFNTFTGFGGGVFSTTIQADGKIIVGGNFSSYNGTDGIIDIARLNSDGTRDTTFNTGTSTSTWSGYVVYSTTIQADGKIVVGGKFTSYNGTKEINNIVRLNTNGMRDITFKTSTGFNDFIFSTVIQSDGKIIVGGEFTSYNGTTGINRLVRLNANGTQDTTFKTGAGFNDFIYSTVIQSDGKIIVGGYFTSYNGTTGINRIVRLNANGSRDITFNTGTGFNHIVRSTAIQADGKIIVGGSFNSFNGISGIGNIVRLNADGTLDTTFYTGTGFNNIVSSTSIQADGKIIVGGDFTSFNGISGINRIVRLNADGTLDNNFNTGLGFDGSVHSISILADGKIIVGGKFTSLNGTNGINRIVRLNADGTRDMTFNIGTGFNVDVNSISIQLDGKIIVGGVFNAYNGTTGISRIVRLNANGILDITFNTGTGFNGPVNSISIQSDGKIIVGGQFTSFNSNGKNRLTRLLGGCIPTPSSQNVTACNTYKWLANGVTYTSSGTYTAKLCDSIVTLNLTITSALTTSVNGVTITANETGATYQWIDCNNANAPITGETNQSFTATANGNYAVIVTKNTCSDTSACVAITKVGGNKIEALHSNFQVFPNPNNGTFSLQTNYSALGTVSITNALGELVFSEIIKAPKAEINLSAFGSGVYFVEVTTNGFISRQKIVISK
ncbi:MAG: T9SS C-terminal target domain-containing protein [Bacteroidetes bacterium]|nr:MAG: T9SS C-terminal target domain-containing protein [Bacteroidota bacterium]